MQCALPTGRRRFNGDGRLDLATACYFANSVTVVLGDGAGGFGTPSSFGVSDGPQGLAVGDFNGDGKPDLAVACQTAGKVSILLGNGAGGFGAANSFNAGATPRDVEVGDFNGDGKQDLASANWDSNNVTILLGDCALTPTATVVSSSANPSNVGQSVSFTASVTSSIGTPGGMVEFFENGQSLGTANLSSGSAALTTTALSAGGHSITTFYSGDATHLPSTSPILSQTVNKWATQTSLGISTNPSVAGQAVTFTASVTSGTGTPTGSVEFFDYGQSLGVINLSSGSVSLTTAGLTAGSHLVMAVYSGNAKYLGSTSPALIQTVAAVTPVGSNVTVQETAGATTVMIKFSGVTVPGTTSITPIDPASAGTLPGGFSVGGLAFDISTTASFVGPITVCFQVPSVTDPVAFSNLRILHSAPKLDLATVNSGSNNASVLLGNGAGGFPTAANFAVGSSPRSVAVGDFNGDGKPDLAVANFNSKNVSILLGNGSGGFGSATNIPVGGAPGGIGTGSIAVGDFNGDGKQDLAVINYPDVGDPRVSILLGNGSGGFGPQTNFVVGHNPTSVTVGDFNGDGKVDLAVASYLNDVSIMLGNGVGGFSAPMKLSVTGLFYSLAVGDFNGDGKLDLAVANYGLCSGNSCGAVSILLGNGSGGFSSATNFMVGAGPVSIAVGDFNGDGKQDLVTANAFPNSMSVLLGNGTGGFGPATNLTMNSNSNSVVVADFNNDSKLDLATANTGSNNISVRFGLGTGSFGAATNYPVGTNPYAIAAGNFNSDVVVIDQTILSGPNVPNFATKTICAQVLSFSPFVIASVLDQTPPVITNMSASPSVIWPPDHNMIDVTVNYGAFDDFTPPAAIVPSLEVSSNEPVNTTGDGNTEPDIEIVDAHHVRLRAERSGSGDGRVYTITITCKDSAQNASTRTVTVVVPRNQ
ncbi:MAG: FG-GAP-like repeat-containing protein [Blastocatellia bacterium]